jgi:hypothetical protein
MLSIHHPKTLPYLIKTVAQLCIERTSHLRVMCMVSLQGFLKLALPAAKLFIQRASNFRLMRMLIAQLCRRLGLRVQSASETIGWRVQVSVGAE